MITHHQLIRRGSVPSNPERLFRALHSFSGLSTGAVVALGLVLVITAGVFEWATDLPIPDDIAFVLIVGGVTFHGSAGSGVALAFLAGLARVLSSGIPLSGDGIGWSLATVEGLSLMALLLGFVLVAHALDRAINTLQHQALMDPLTGALNTRGFMDVAERERLRALRKGYPMTIAYFDIDGLKDVNDGAGHEAGDSLLLEFVSAVSVSIRAYDIFGRLGGDEFVLVLPATDQREAIRAVSRISEGLGFKDPPLSVSVGVVTYPTPREPLGILVQNADRFMYKAKREGGNRVVGTVWSFDEDLAEDVIKLSDLAETAPTGE